VVSTTIGRWEPGPGRRHSDVLGLEAISDGIVLKVTVAVLVGEGAHGSIVRAREESPTSSVTMSPNARATRLAAARRSTSPGRFLTLYTLALATGSEALISFR